MLCEGGDLHHHASKAVLKVALMMIVMIILGNIQIEMMVHAKSISFRSLGESYPIIKDEIPTYFFKGDFRWKATYFRGYLEFNLNDNTQLSGRYTVNALYGVAFQNTPSIVVDERLGPKVYFRWDLTQVKLPKGVAEQATLKFSPQFGLNVNPYSIRAFQITPKGTVVNEYNFNPIFPQSLNDRPTLGPWEFIINLESFVGNYFDFVIFAYSAEIENFNTPIPITYPRDVSYSDGNNGLVMIYESASVLSPNEVEKPTITVGIYNSSTIPNNIDGYVPVFNYKIEENNLARYNLDETREFLLGQAISFNNKKIDTYSLKCAYAVDADFKVFTIDESSTVTIDDSKLESHKLICVRHIPESTYVLAIVGKVVDYNYCSHYPGRTTPCQITPSQIMHFENLGSATYVTFNPETTITGDIKPIDYPISSFTRKFVQETIQHPLNLIQVFGFDFSEASKGQPTKPEQNIVNIKVEQVLRQTNQDPNSLRMFILDENTFKLVSPDTPSTFTVEANVDLNHYFSGRPLTIGLFIYENTISTTGALNYVNYPRNVVFPLSGEISLTMKFEKSYEQYITYDKRPYFTLNSYPVQRDDFDFNFVIFSFMQQNGNGLETYGFDENRIFTISYNTRFYDGDRELSFRFQDLRCVYLFKESNFKTTYFSNDVPKAIEANQEYVLNCDEDIREESFVFMLVAKTYHPHEESQQFNTEYLLDPNTMGVYRGQLLYQNQYLKDSVYVKFDANSKSVGKYKLNLDRNDYSNYEFPGTEFERLSFITAFEVDVSGITIQQDRASFDKQITVGYLTDMNSTRHNFDPFSYSFFLFDQQNRKLKFESTESVNGRWELTLDMTTILGKFTIAVFAYTGNSGKFGDAYELTYDRSLKYEIAVDQFVEFSFSSPSFPDFVSNAFFTLAQKETIPLQIDGYVLVGAFTISQTVKANIFTTRAFSYNNRLLDNNQDKISDFTNLQCVYVIPGKPHFFGFGIVTKTSATTFTLECLEAVGVENYDWAIVAKKSTGPINPVHSINPDESKSKDDGQQGAITFLVILVAILFIIICALFTLIIGYVVYTKKFKHPQLKSSNEYESEDLKVFGNIQRSYQNL